METLTTKPGRKPPRRTVRIGGVHGAGGSGARSADRALEPFPRAARSAARLREAGAAGFAPDRALDGGGKVPAPAVRDAVRGRSFDRRPRRPRTAAVQAPAVRRRVASVPPLAAGSPDRFAAWAFALGLLLVVVAATSAHFAPGG